MDDRISELPDCILSCILKMLPMKDVVKTSTLSKKWYKRWALRRDLYFDIFNVLGSLKELLQTHCLVDVNLTSTVVPGFYFPCSVNAVERHIDLSRCLGEFMQGVDQFVNNFPGTKVDSFLVNFPLDFEQNTIINQWIRFAIARGVERIDLLFLGRPYAPPSYIRNPYKLDFGLFLDTNTSAVIHLGIENSILYHPINCDLIQFNNLRSLSLEEVKLDEALIESMLSNCPRLEELCLLICEFKSSMPVIASSSLCHLKVIGCYFLPNNSNDKRMLNLISLHCFKLTSLEVDSFVLTSSEDGLDTLNFNTPILKSIKFFISLKQDLNRLVSRCATGFPKLEIMHVTTLSMVTTSPQITQQFKHLQQLNLVVFVDSYILGDVEYDPLWILDILQASPLLQKLSVMFGASECSKNQNDIRDVERFYHEEVKVVELGGCVGNWYEIEFVMNILKYAHKLEQIVVSWRKDESLSWESDSELFESGCKGMRKILQGQEVVGREKLVFID